MPLLPSRKMGNPALITAHNHLEIPLLAGPFGSHILPQPGLPKTHWRLYITLIGKNYGLFRRKSLHLVPTGAPPVYGLLWNCKIRDMTEGFFLVPLPVTVALGPCLYTSETEEKPEFPTLFSVVHKIRLLRTYTLGPVPLDMTFLFQSYSLHRHRRPGSDSWCQQAPQAHQAVSLLPGRPFLCSSLSPSKTSFGWKCLPRCDLCLRWSKTTPEHCGCPSTGQTWFKLGARSGRSEAKPSGGPSVSSISG
jgi:hypothetical protein